jgi:predicted nucleic acid-binding protein
MTFVDTSAIYAWADAGDPNHERAVRRLQALLDAGETLLTHNYVLVEALALLQARLGLAAAVKLARDSSQFVVEWVDDDLHATGLAELMRSKKRHVSLVDHISFLVMTRRGVTTAFAFDPDFTSAGFRLVGGNTPES